MKCSVSWRLVMPDHRADTIRRDVANSAATRRVAHRPEPAADRSNTSVPSNTKSRYVFRRRGRVKRRLSACRPAGRRGTHRSHKWRSPRYARSRIAANQSSRYSILVSSIIFPRHLLLHIRLLIGTARYTTCVAIHFVAFAGRPPGDGVSASAGRGSRLPGLTGRPVLARRRKSLARGRAGLPHVGRRRCRDLPGRPRRQHAASGPPVAGRCGGIAVMVQNPVHRVNPTDSYAMPCNPVPRIHRRRHGELRWMPCGTRAAGRQPMSGIGDAKS